ARDGGSPPSVLAPGATHRSGRMRLPSSRAHDRACTSCRARSGGEAQLTMARERKRGGGLALVQARQSCRTRVPNDPYRVTYLTKPAWRLGLKIGCFDFTAAS